MAVSNARIEDHRIELLDAIVAIRNMSQRTPHQYAAHGQRQCAQAEGVKPGVHALQMRYSKRQVIRICGVIRSLFARGSIASITPSNS